MAQEDVRRQAGACRAWQGGCLAMEVYKGEFGQAVSTLRLPRQNLPSAQESSRGWSGHHQFSRWGSKELGVKIRFLRSFRVRDKARFQRGLQDRS